MYINVYKCKYIYYKYNPTVTADARKSFFSGEKSETIIDRSYENLEWTIENGHRKEMKSLECNAIILGLVCRGHIWNVNIYF